MADIIEPAGSKFLNEIFCYVRKPAGSRLPLITTSSRLFSNLSRSTLKRALSYPIAISQATLQSLQFQEHLMCHYASRFHDRHHPSAQLT